MAAEARSQNLAGLHENTKSDFELLDTLMKAVDNKEFKEIIPAAWAIVSRYSAVAHEREFEQNQVKIGVFQSGAKQNATFIRPEWGDCKAVKQYFGLSRSVVYRLKNEGKITTSSLNEPDLKPKSEDSQEGASRRGKRLFKLDSVANYLESLATGGKSDV
jgi:hypothetical protein